MTQLFTVTALASSVLNNHHHGLVLVVECVGDGQASHPLFRHLVKKYSPCAIPFVDFTTSSTSPYSVRNAAMTSPLNWIGTLYTVTFIRLLPMHSS